MYDRFVLPYDPLHDAILFAIRSSRPHSPRGIPPASGAVFAQLKLAPPYESVEKAIRTFTTSLHARPPEEQARIASDAHLQWREFRQAFETSGLVKKHRGIIAGLARNRSAVDLPAEYDHFLDLFTASRPDAR